MSDAAVRDELAFDGAAALAGRLRDRELSSRELTEMFLERIERIDPKLNAFRTVWAEEALAAADAADERLAAGTEAPLLGVPIAIKDTVDVAGDVTMLGTNGFDRPAERDSEIVARLRGAGAVFLGKTNLPELAIHGFTETETFGDHPQPLGHRAHPGGSSGGSGAAVAAGHGGSRPRLGRRRLDPLSGGQLRAVRAEAAARQGPDRLRALVRALGQRLRQLDGRRHGAVPGRGHGWTGVVGERAAGARAQLRRGRRGLAGPAADRPQHEAAAGDRPAAARPTNRGTRSRRRPSCSRRWATTSVRRDPDWGYDRQPDPGPLPGRDRGGHRRRPTRRPARAASPAATGDRLGSRRPAGRCAAP